MAEAKFPIFILALIFIPVARGARKKMKIKTGHHRTARA